MLFIFYPLWNLTYKYSLKLGGHSRINQLWLPLLMVVLTSVPLCLFCLKEGRYLTCSLHRVSGLFNRIIYV